MAGCMKTSTLGATLSERLSHCSKLRMVIASAALLNDTGLALIIMSVKMMIVLNSLTSLNNECFLASRMGV